MTLLIYFGLIILANPISLRYICAEGIPLNGTDAISNVSVDESNVENGGSILDDIASRSDSVPKDSRDQIDSPFDEIATRSPITKPENWQVPQSYSNQERQHCCSVNPIWWNIYPSLRPKDSTYCSQMYGMFLYTCQPGKPLRIDLLQFCEEYSGFCGVPNRHRFPGLRTRTDQRSQSAGGNVGVGGNFGFGIGVVPGLDVGVGWGVDVGPFPWFNDNIGVGLNTGVGVLGNTSPEKIRRGEDSQYDRNAGGNFGLKSDTNYKYG